jgi:hypothetical protein
MVREPFRRFLVSLFPYIGKISARNSLFHFFRTITLCVFGLDDAGNKSILPHFFLSHIIHLGKTSIVKAIQGGKIHFTYSCFDKFVLSYSSH